jgi:spermidine synthase
MIPWVHLASAAVPDGVGELRLNRRGAEFSIMSGTIELMNSRLSGSEEALATLVARRLAGRKAPSVLIGGLGMGFTLRAALAAFGPDAHLTVAELVPEVVDWARGPMAELSAGCLDDPRVTVEIADVAALIRPEAGHSPAPRWDAVLLDVDNGPEGLTRRVNERLYDHAGLAVSRAALRPGGVLAVWSQGPDRAFSKRLRDAGFAVEEVTVRAHRGRKGARHVVWLATR